MCIHSATEWVLKLICEVVRLNTDKQCVWYCFCGERFANYIVHPSLKGRSIYCLRKVNLLDDVFWRSSASAQYFSLVNRETSSALGKISKYFSKIARRSSLWSHSLHEPCTFTLLSVSLCSQGCSLLLKFFRTSRCNLLLFKLHMTVQIMSPHLTRGCHNILNPII